MSWLFSQALVEASSAATCLDGEPSAPSSGNPTQLAFLPPDRMTAFSRPSRSGMTFRPLTDDLGAAVLTWCLEGSRARTLALQAKAQESTENDQACGATWRGSLARFDPDSCSWRTVQHSLLEDLGESSVIWPRSGMTANGQCWELPTLGRRISGTGSGLSGIPTPGAQDGSGGGAAMSNLKGQVHLRDWVKTWPTPTSQGFDAGGTDPRRSLYTAVRATWPTPTVCGNHNRKGLSPKSGGGLATAVQKWPTPIASDSRGSSGKPAPGKQTQLVDAVRFATPLSRDWRSGKTSQATAEKNSRPLSEQIGGSLNPTWVEWLMGWPLGWTDLKPLVTDKSRSAPPLPGDC